MTKEEFEIEYNKIFDRAMAIGEKTRLTMMNGI